MHLHIKERIYTPAILPKGGTYAEFNMKKSIASKVAITEEEKAKYSITEEQTEDGPRVKWDVKADMENPTEIKFTEDEISFLKKSCEELGDVSMPDEFWGVVEKIYNA